MKASDLCEEFDIEQKQEPTIAELSYALRLYATVAMPSSISQLCETCAARMERMEMALNEKHDNEYKELEKENEKLKAKYGILSDLYSKLLDKVCALLSD